MRPEAPLTLSGFACLAIAFFAGLLTWLCVGWFGNQSLLTAMIAVVLVELFLACFGVIAILLTERVTVTLLDLEKRPAPVAATRAKHPPVWLRVPSSPFAPETTTVAQASEPTDWASTIPFPLAGETTRDDNIHHHRPAA